MQHIKTDLSLTTEFHDDFYEDNVKLKDTIHYRNLEELILYAKLFNGVEIRKMDEFIGELKQVFDKIDDSRS